MTIRRSQLIHRRFHRVGALMSGIIVAVGIIMAAPVAMAEGMTMRQFLRDVESDTSGVLRDMFIFTGNGIDVVNGMMATTKRQPFYCKPENLKLTFEQSLGIVKDFVYSVPKIRDADVSVVEWRVFYVYAMVKAFPCK
jgi:hypothetical protein